MIRQKVGGRQDKWVMLLLTCSLQQTKQITSAGNRCLLLRNKCGVNFSTFKLKLFLILEITIKY